MAVAKGENRGRIAIHYEETGSGEPLVLIGGLTSTLEAWGLMLPELARHLRVITPDNRGSGRTRLEADDGVRTPERFAGDILVLADDLGLDRFHLMGVSMGGMIVQEFALAHPERLASLVIGCSHAGGASVVSASPEDLQAMVAGAGGGAGEEARMAAMAVQIHPDTPRLRADRLAWFMKTKTDQPHGPDELARRIRGISQYDVHDRLPGLAVPTLVMTGSHDRLVPGENSRILASRIPGAEFVEIPDAGHIFFAEQPDAANAALLDFLERHPISASTNPHAM